ncbi:MAG TPA: hypothetical protein VHI52_17970, partial [Verrucomicrobiae bacterium]|nr:hypothetical protein [Verrucomicrobiae bacterium]
LSGAVGQQLFFNAKGVTGGGAYWTLYDPENRQMGSVGLAGDFQFTLPYAGTYFLVLSAGASTVNYTNQVNTFANTASALTLGAKTISAIVNPGDQLTYTFNGTVGQRIYYDARQTNYNNCQVSLVSPTGVTLVNQGAGSDRGPLTLTQTGVYSLTFYGSGDSTGQVSFQVLDLADATPTSPGTTITESLTDETETRLYRLAGTVGQRLSLKSLSGSNNHAVWALLGLADQTLGPEPYITQDIGSLTLPTSGNFVLAVIGTGLANSPLNYQLSVTDISDSPAASTGFGVVQSGTVNSGQTNSFTYTASAGLPVFFDSQDASGQNLAVDLVAPDGTAVFTVGETSDNGPYILPRSGTYTLQVRGYNGTASGNFSFRLLDLSASPVLAFNTAVSHSLDNPYQTDVYQFTSSAGQILLYDALTNDVDYPSVTPQLLDPRSQAIPLGSSFGTDRGPFLIQYPGTCYLSFRNNRSSSRSYAFRLLDPASQPALAVNVSVTNNLDVYPTLVFKYSGVAGQSLYFAGQQMNPSGVWSLYDPNGASVPGAVANTVGDFETTLPVTGTYTLVLSSSSSSPGPEVFRVNDFAYLTNSYTVGTALVNAISEPGERRTYTFTGTVGQRLIYDAQTNDPPAPSVISVQLLNPEGQGEGPIGGRFSSDRGPFTLQQSGMYSLVLDGNGAGVGPFAFQLLDVSALPAAPVNSLTTNILSGYTSICYRLSGTAGQQFYFHSDPNNPSGSWNLYDPNNYSVGSAGLSGDFEVTLPIDGTYVLILSGYGTTAPVVFQINDYSYFTNSYTLGTPVVDAINRPGERRSYTFTGAAGQRLIY